MVKLVAYDLQAKFISLVLLPEGQNLVVSKYIFIPVPEEFVRVERLGSSKVITAKESTYLIVMNLHSDHRTVESLFWIRTQCPIAPHIGWAHQNDEISNKLATLYTPNASSSSRYGLQRVILLPGEKCYVDMKNKSQGWILPAHIILNIKASL